MTMGCEDANSKLVEVVADVDAKILVVWCRFGS